MNRFHYILKLTILVILFSGCSTKKKTWFHRTYHNTTAKYNGYYNGNQSLKKGIKKIHEKNKDDYTTTLSVFPEKSLKTKKQAHSFMDKGVKKGSLVIQRHSIKIKGKEYCKWIDDSYLLVGKSYFYKGDFEEATKTFNYIKDEYNEEKMIFEASCWLVRSYLEDGDYSSARVQLEELFNIKNITKKQERHRNLVAADYYLQTKNKPQATNYLVEYVGQTKRKAHKSRQLYILAQIYQQIKNFEQSKKYYKQVLKSTSEYEMAFNAKMNIAISLKASDGDQQKTKKELQKMLNDEKNNDYLDRIYYTLAEMEINNKDTSAAINYLIQSTLNSTEATAQKALSFLKLSNIYYKQENYHNAAKYLDSTVFYMSTDFRLYEETKNRRDVISDLVGHIQTIALQDSLQALAKMPLEKQKTIINSIIVKKKEQEKELEANKRTQSQLPYNNRGMQDQFSNNASGGKWYFYNPAALSFGFSEFKKKWGKRKLEDDWRRKNKSALTELALDTTNTDSTALTEDKNNPNYYLEKIPNTSEEFLASNTEIKTALFELGGIYFEELNKTKKSNECYHSIIDRFPDDKSAVPLALYEMYYNYKFNKDTIKQKQTKDKLIKAHPESIYSKLLNNTNYLSTLQQRELQNEQEYSELVLLYTKGMYENVIEMTKAINNDYLKNKKQLIRALSLIQLENSAAASRILTKLAQGEGETAIFSEEILSLLKDPSQIQKANERALSGSSYLYRSGDQHMLLVLVPKKSDITYLKTVVSDFNTKEITDAVFEISALLLGNDHHIIMIKYFENAKEAMEYYYLFQKNQAIFQELQKTDHKIMLITSENFKSFYKDNDVEGYHSFFLKNYLGEK